MKIKSHPRTPGAVRRLVSVLERGVDKSRGIVKPALQPIKNVKSLVARFEQTVAAEAAVSVERVKKNLKSFVRPSKFRHIFCVDLESRRVPGIDLLSSASIVADVSVDSYAVGYGRRLIVANWTSSDSNRMTEVTHAAKIGCVEWHPRCQNLLASADDDGNVRVWNFSGAESLLKVAAEFNHGAKVNLIRFNPLVKSILLSASLDRRIVLWRSDSAVRIWEFSVERLVFDLRWNPSGNFFAASSKDGYVRVVDPRQSAIRAVDAEFLAHAHSLETRVTPLKDGRLFTSGTSSSSVREIALWPANGAASEPLFRNRLDDGPGTYNHIYDPDHSLVYVHARGEASLRVFQIDSVAPFVHFLTRHAPNSVGRLRCVAGGETFFPLPKSELDRETVEIQKLARLDARGKRMRVISVRVPRRNSLIFHQDLYGVESWERKPMCDPDTWWVTQK